MTHPHPTTRFVLLARTSTEDLQSPVDSLGWQRARAEQLVSANGGVIVEVVHDIDVSRSIPWKRRPGASALLERVRQGHPGLRRHRCRRGAAERSATSNKR